MSLMDFIVLLVLSNVIFALLGNTAQVEEKDHVLVPNIQRKKVEKLTAI